ncbi:MAG: hypothetical protein AAGA90_23575 [Actinomycetota bacterium]
MPGPSLLERCTRYPIEEVTAPKDGATALVDRWWVVVDGCVLGYQAKTDGPGAFRHMGSPQCNSDRRVVDHRLGLAWGVPGSTVQQIPLVFWRFDQVA